METNEKYKQSKKMQLQNKNLASTPAVTHNTHKNYGFPGFPNNFPLLKYSVPL